MKLIRDIQQIDSSLSRCAITLGNFDGVHRGHAQIIERLKSWAHRVEGLAIVFTFDPHPVRLLRPSLAPPPLTWTERKAELLSQLEVDCMIAWPTDRALLNLNYKDFFQQIIVDTLDAAAIVEGPNFFFGRNREGNVHRLREMCDKNSIHCEIVEPGISGDDLISSTRIRNLVKQGSVFEARQMLTRPYRIRGMVVHGNGRGSEIGFPTANLDAIDTLIPMIGVYAGLATVGGRQHIAAIHIGPSPTFGTKRLSVEVHLIDFDQKVYGQVIEVDFLETIRTVQRFDSAESLKTQLGKDVGQSREIGARFLGELHNQSDLEF